jgi:hypothetical protein
MVGQLNQLLSNQRELSDCGVDLSELLGGLLRQQAATGSLQQLPNLGQCEPEGLGSFDRLDFGHSGDRVSAVTTQVLVWPFE